MGTHTLTELQYSEDRAGPWKLYIYEPNSEWLVVRAVRIWQKCAGTVEAARSRRELFAGRSGSG